jgi:peptide deformylase
MILPAVTYGHHILRKQGCEIAHSSLELNELIKNMWETMNAAGGVGLAAQQVNHAVKLLNSKLKRIRSGKVKTNYQTMCK